jgi:uncharacterized membrane protein
VDDLAHLVALLLAACFAWAGLSKILRPRRWRDSLPTYGSLARVAAPAVPVAELAVAALLIASPRAGAAAAGILLVVFIGALLRARGIAGDKLPCACFGETRERDWRVLAARNASLIAAAAVAFTAGRPPGPEAVPAVLAAAGLALAAWTALAARAAFRR